MNPEEIINSLRIIASRDLWCKDMGERIATDQLFIEALRKGGRGMPPIVRKLCVALGYIRKEGSGLHTKYLLTPEGEKMADQEESKLNGFIEHIAKHS